MGYGCSVYKSNETGHNVTFKKERLIDLKIKTVLEPETVMSSSKTAVASPRQSDTQFILV